MVQVIRTVQRMKSYSIEQFISGNFMYVPIHEIHREDVDSFLAWSIYVSHLHKLTDAEKEVVLQTRLTMKEMQEIQEMQGIIKRTNPGNKHTDTGFHNMDSITIRHKPLLFYAFIGAIECTSGLLYYRRYGFQRRYYNGISYWVRPGKEGIKGIPVLFFHGICTGWTYYASFMQTVFDPDQTVLLIDYKWVQLNWISLQGPDVQTYLKYVNEIAQQYTGNTRVSLIGHSYGTFLAGAYARMYPVKQLVLIDPIAISLIFPEATYNLLYKPVTSWHDVLLDYFVRGDPSIHHCLNRHFTWYNSCLFLEDVPPSIEIVLFIGEKDAMIPLAPIQELVQIDNEHVSHATKDRTRVIVMPGIDHGQAIMEMDALKLMRDAMK